MFMSNQSIKNTILFVVLAGLLFNVSFFCHFFSMGMDGHSDMDKIFTKQLRFVSMNNSHCCTTQGSSQIISDQILTSKPINQTLLAESLLGFILLLVLVFDLKFLDSQNNSRYRYYRDRRLFSRLYNYILRFLSKGILQPKIYNA